MRVLANYGRYVNAHALRSNTRARRSAAAIGNHCQVLSRLLAASLGSLRSNAGVTASPLVTSADESLVRVTW